jgi:putative pyrroloquinoline-quinone binding quinoprotein
MSRGGVILLAVLLQDIEPSLPGDEGPLRNQTELPTVPDLLRQKLKDADQAFEAGNVAHAFSLLRQVAVEALDPDGTPLLVPLDHGREDRLFADPTVVLRARAASLSGHALDVYRADAEPAGSVELSASRPLAQTLARAARFPRTEVATRTLQLVAERLLERGDISGARAAYVRLLVTGAGSAAQRAGWLQRAFSLAPEGAFSVSRAAEPQRAAGHDAISIPPPGRLRERWRVATPASPSDSGEPHERLAVEVAGSIVVQTGGELILLDGADGALRGRASLPRPAREQEVAPRWRARPSSDGLFIAATNGGALSLFELSGSGLALRWTREGSGGSFYADGALVTGGRVLVASVLPGAVTSTSIEALDPMSGERIFARLLARGSTVGAADRPPGRKDLVVPAPLASAGGLAIVSTELGVVAAVDPLDGEIVFALKTQRSREPHAYEASSPQAADGAFHACPSDSDYLYSLQAAAPDLARDAPLPFAFGSAPLRRRGPAFSRLVGAFGSRALFLGREPRAQRVLKSFDVATRQIDDVELAPGEEALGSPALVGSGLYLSTDHGVTSIALEEELRPLALLPPPVDPATGGRLRAADVYGDLSPVSGGVVSVTRSWISRYDIER